MSRSNAPLQATINKWCNVEAVHAYADRLDEWADSLCPMFAPSFDQSPERLDSIALRNAAHLLRLAATDAAKTTNEAQRHAYDRIYRKPAA